MQTLCWGKALTPCLELASVYRRKSLRIINNQPRNGQSRKKKKKVISLNLKIKF